MLWIVREDSSIQIEACNIHKENEKFQLWVTRPGGKTLKIDESENLEKIQEVKDAIDFAVENEIKTLRL